ncbi:MAG: hypothetical protein ACE5GM_07070, partial [bacterium]
MVLSQVSESLLGEFAALFSGSPYLFQIFLENLDYFMNEALIKGTLSCHLSQKELYRSYEKHIEGVQSGPSATQYFADSLKTFKDRQILRIGLADLLKKLNTVEVTEELSDLACFCLERAYRAGLARLTERYGRPVCEEGERCSFVALGMGKLGGRELNFSSDIDIIFVYHPDNGKTDGNKQLTNYEFYSQLATFISNTLHKNRIYRVDLGLRPEGKSGPVALSLVAAELYYESWGQTWERQALIKARPCAGDLKLGKKFLKTLQPFIYRKSLDLSAISQIKKMKILIDSQPQSNIKKSSVNIKLGPGGIRELEFIVQSFQLIYGGRIKRLQNLNTLCAIREIAAIGLINTEDRDILTSAYLFLRELENMIQMFQGRQTQAIPGDKKELEALATKMRLTLNGEPAGERLMAQYRFHAEKVSRIYRQVFKERDVPVDSGKKPVSHPLLEEVGFDDIGRVRKDFHRLRNGRNFTETSGERETLFDKTFPLILDFCKEIPDPDKAVANLEKFVFSYKAEKSLFALCCSEPGLLELLLRLFGNSEFLSQILIKMPELFDQLFALDSLESAKSPAVMRNELQDELEKLSDEERLVALVKYVRSEELRIGTRYLI